MNPIYRQSNLLDLPLGLSENVSFILAARNLTSIEKVLKSSHIDLMSSGLTLDEIESLKSSVSAYVPSGDYLTVLEYESILNTKWRCIKFGCTALDRITQNGLPIRGITEIVGESGCGKSQICMQLALNVQLPLCDGGLEKGAVYICTEDAFPSKRLVQMVEHRNKTYQRDHKWLDKIFIEHCPDSEKLLNCVCSRLPLLMRTNSIGLIVIDSVAGIFRLESDAVERAASMRKLVLKLQHLADEYECAVVCVNQVTASMNNRIRDKCIPSLGLAWSNLVRTQFKIRKLAKQIPPPMYSSRSGSGSGSSSGGSRSSSSSCTISNSPISIRSFEIGLSPELPNKFAEFIITARGICDVPPFVQ